MNAESHSSTESGQTTGGGMTTEKLRGKCPIANASSPDSKTGMGMESNSNLSSPGSSPSTWRTISDSTLSRYKVQHSVRDYNGTYLSLSLSLSVCAGWEVKLEVLLALEEVT